MQENVTNTTNNNTTTTKQSRIRLSSKIRPQDRLDYISEQARTQIQMNDSKKAKEEDDSSEEETEYEMNQQEKRIQQLQKEYFQNASTNPLYPEFIYVENFKTGNFQSLSTKHFAQQIQKPDNEMGIANNESPTTTLSLEQKRIVQIRHTAKFLHRFFLSFYDICKGLLAGFSLYLLLFLLLPQYNMNTILNIFSPVSTFSSQLFMIVSTFTFVFSIYFVWSEYKPSHSIRELQFDTQSKQIYRIAENKFIARRVIRIIETIVYGFVFLLTMINHSSDDYLFFMYNKFGANWSLTVTQLYTNSTLTTTNSTITTSAIVNYREMMGRFIVWNICILLRSILTIFTYIIVKIGFVRASSLTLNEESQILSSTQWKALQQQQ